MSRRIEVELTSTRDDGTWTWRAAGAKQPKGVVDAKLLYDGVRVGDVVRAEADFEMEGILITSVQPPREKRSEPERLQIIGPPREQEGVTSSLVPKSERPRPERRDRDGRDGRSERGGTHGSPPRSGAPSRPREEGAARTGVPRADGRPRPEGRPRADGRVRPGGARREDGPSGPTRQAGQRPDNREGREGRERRPAAQAAEAAPKPKRLSPANVHRAAVLDTLPPEQRPIAEQVLRGGIPAVRQALQTQNARLREEGQSEVGPGPLLALAEQLLPQLKAAEWRDRAEAAAKVVDEVSLRDLRSVVAGADAARDDEGRLLAGTLRQALERRVNEHRERWVTEITGALDEGRLVRALRLSAHPPDPATRFPAELALRLSEAAGAAMTAEATADRWATLLEAVAESPVRRSVKPVALPAEPTEPLLQAARQASGRVPALAPLLGITMPPPPGPPRPTRPASRGGRPPGQGGARRRPPPQPGPTKPPGTPAPEAANPIQPTESPMPATQPAEPAIAPAEATVAPAEPAMEPAEATVEPAEATVEPGGPAMAPAEPAEATVEPAEATVEPAEPAMAPAEAPVEPAEPSISPAGAPAEDQRTTDLP